MSKDSFSQCVLNKQKVIKSLVNGLGLQTASKFTGSYNFVAASLISNYLF